MDRKQRDHELTHVEAALRLEMERLDRLVQKQNGTAPGMGIARESVAASFPNLPLVNKNEAAGHKSEHFAIEDPAGSIHMRGPFDNLTHIGFFGALHGAHGEASMSMLSTLLSCAFPHWEAGQRELWIKKLTNVDDQVFIYRDFDHLRVTWLWMMICGIRLDVLSIETK